MTLVSWVTVWRKAGIPEDIINRFYKLYGEPAPEVTLAMLDDDRRIGIGKLSLPYTNDEIAHHDLEMKLSALGFPISCAVETQTDFAIGTITRGAKGLGFAAVAIPIAVAGSVVGAGIMIYRALN